MYIGVERRLLTDPAMTAVDLLSGFDTAPLADLDNMVLRLERDEGFKVPAGTIDSIRASWKEHQELKGAQRLGELTGYTAIRADYAVAQVAKDALALVASVGTVSTASVAVYYSDK